MALGETKQIPLKILTGLKVPKRKSISQNDQFIRSGPGKPNQRKVSS